MRSALPLLSLALLAACATTTAPARPAAPPPPSPAVRELASLADAVCACADGDCAGTAYEALVERSVTLDTPGDRAALDAAHDRAADCYADRAGLPRGEQAAALASGLADAVCACQDGGCAEAARARHLRDRETLEDAVLGRDDRAAIDAAGARLDACLARLPAPSGEEMLAFYEQMADALCACTTMDCVEALGERMEREQPRFRGARVAKATADRIVAASQRGSACVRKLAGTPPADGARP